MKHGFSHMILKLKSNPCIERQKRPQQWRKCKLINRNSKQCILIVFFDIKGIILLNMFLVDSVYQYYIEVLIKLRDHVKRSDQICRKMTGFFIKTMFQLSVHLQFNIFVTKKNISILQHTPYSPNLASCNFFPLLKLSS